MQQIFLLFFNVKTIKIFDLFSFSKITFIIFLTLPSDILVPGERLIFYFDCVMCTYIYIKIIPMVTKVLNKYKKNEITSCSIIYRTMCHKNSYLLFLEKISY